MFEDVPDKLKKIILTAPDDFWRPEIFRGFVAMAVVSHYLGTTFSASSDRFLSFDQRVPDTVPWQRTARIDQIAESVFRLRCEPGFEEICRRLKSRGLRAAAFEAEAARMFHQHGFSILSRSEKGSFGEDFDFSISGHGIVANVEATAFEDQVWNPSSITNALRHKRGQLPREKPAIIVGFIPGTWRFTVPNFEHELQMLAERFLRSTQRINYLVFGEDVQASKGDGGIAFLHVIQHKNQRPRHVAHGLDEALATAPEEDSEAWDLLRRQPSEAVGTGKLQQFVEWLRCQRGV